MTRTYESQWMGIQEHAEVCRLVIERILNKGPKFRFPEREMPVTDWLVWLDMMAAVAKVLGWERWVPKDNCRIGVDIGAIRFCKPAEGRLVTHMLVEGAKKAIVGQRNIKFSDIGGKWKALSNDSVNAAKLSNEK